MSALRLLAAIVALCGTTSLRAFAQPELEWEQTHHRLAASALDESLEVVYHFTNSGSEELLLKGAFCPCPCVSLSWDREELRYAPGEKGVLSARFTTGDRTGVHRKRISVVSAERREVAVLRMEVDIAQVLELRPLFVFWKTGEESGAERELEVHVPPESELLGVEVLKGPFEAAIHDSPEPGQRVLRIRAQDLGKPLRGEAAVYGRSGEGPRKRYIVHLGIQ